MEKILSTEPVNRLGFIQNMSYVWETNEEVSIESLGKQLFYFSLQGGERQTLDSFGRPWHSAGSLIVLEEPKGVGEIREMRFDRATF